MEIILIRHGQSKGNEQNIVQGQLDEGLSELGLIQAEELSAYFNNLNAIYSSDTGRAIQTAEPTAKKLGLKINIDEDLREASFGIWEGMTYDEVKEKYSIEYKAWNENYHIRPSWFEAYDIHQSRVMKVLEKILSNHKTGEKIAVFSHGGSIKTQVGFFKKLNGIELTKVRISNCSLSLISFSPPEEYKNGELAYFSKDVVKNKTPMYH
jgi:broad specificity phosphatase PhoE